MGSGRRRAVVWLAAILLAFLGLTVRVGYINTTLRPELAAVARKQQVSRSVIPARRGRILDARGRVVAASRYLPDVFVDPFGVEDLRALAEMLSPRINVPAEEILARIEGRPASRFVVVAEQVDEVTADAVRDLRNPAVGLNNRSLRTYPLGSSLAHVLGFVGRDGHGLEGIELAFDEHLAGRDGRLGSIRDGKRRTLKRSDEPHVPPVDGGDLILTVDAEIQRIAESALSAAVAKFEAECGVAAVMVPATGDVLAMASLPTFDPNHAAEAPPELRRNRAITDPTEPGSTFKPFIACGALEGGFITPTELIDCHLGERHFGRRLVTDTKPHGLLDLKGIVTVSSNIGMATIGTRMGNTALYETIRRFGFGERTGVACPGEASGMLYDLRHWNSYSTTSVSFGYEVSSTPLQLLRGFCAIVNGGLLLKPRIVKQRWGPDGRVIETYPAAEVVGRAVAEPTAHYISREVLVSVVENGTVQQHFQGSYRVMGKTGTAKLPYPDRSGYAPGAYVSTFIGAAPVDEPRVAVVVMVRRPNARLGYYGATVAAPAVAEIIEGTLAYMGVPPDDRVTPGEKGLRQANASLPAPR